MKFVSFELSEMQNKLGELANFESLFHLFFLMGLLSESTFL